MNVGLPIARIAHKTVLISPILQVHFSQQPDSNSCYLVHVQVHDKSFFSILSNHMRINYFGMFQDTK